MILFFTVFVLLLLVSAGGYWYLIQEENDEPIGIAAIYLVKNKSVHDSVVRDIQGNALLPQDEKLAVTLTYDIFLEKYDSLPTKQQTVIKKNLGRLAKKIIPNRQLLATEPLPEEVKNIIAVLLVK